MEEKQAQELFFFLKGKGYYFIVFIRDVMISILKWKSVWNQLSVFIIEYEDNGVYSRQIWEMELCNKLKKATRSQAVKKYIESNCDLLKRKKI